jgi:hypothetical protein
VSRNNNKILNPGQLDTILPNNDIFKQSRKNIISPHTAMANTSRSFNTADQLAIGCIIVALNDTGTNRS